MELFMKPHKWAKEIKAWADGAEIEYRYYDRDTYADEWEVEEYPSWNDALFEYRIKPQPKEPQYLYVYRLHNSSEAGFMLDKNHEAPYAKCVGKIKLEDDDNGND